MPLGQHLLGLEAALGKDRLGALGIFLGALPLLVKGCLPAQHRLHRQSPIGVAEPQVQAQLLDRFPQHAGEHRLGDRVDVTGHGHAHPQLLADQLLFVEDHRQHPLIHRIAPAGVLAGTMQHQRPHRLA
ncbi:MAG: hypothetical protein ACK55I_04465 [bacterium]